MAGTHFKGPVYSQNGFIGSAAGLPSATTTIPGTVLKSATVANVTPATDGTAVGTAFNLLLTNLRAAGIIV